METIAPPTIVLAAEPASPMPPTVAAPTAAPTSSPVTPAPPMASIPGPSSGAEAASPATTKSESEAGKAGTRAELAAEPVPSTTAAAAADPKEGPAAAAASAYNPPQAGPKPVTWYRALGNGIDSFRRMMRGVAVVVVSFILMICTHLLQIAGLPLYLIHRPYYYRYQAQPKRAFALLLTAINQIWSDRPTVIRVSGDASVGDQIGLSADGLLRLGFADRLVMVANHQIYIDWLYLWWSALSAGKAGHFFIVLKESLSRVPVVGAGMRFFSFLFLTRKIDVDRARMEHRLGKLDRNLVSRPQPAAADGSNAAANGDAIATDPMWLLIFPEGTNTSPNARKSSARWAARSGVDDCRHVLLPRATGLRICLRQLCGSVEWMYDCTVAYSGVGRNRYGQDVYTAGGILFSGHVPERVDMHWRRFRIADLPLDDDAAFDRWLTSMWREKDELMEAHHEQGRFPAVAGGCAVETRIRMPTWADVAELVLVATLLGGLVRFLIGAW